MDLKEILGLRSDMSTYFVKAPPEFWAQLGKKIQPYNDVEGEYEFIHAFFTDKQSMTDFSDLLVSKLAHEGILWISWPKNTTDSDITEPDVTEVFTSTGLNVTQKADITENWHGLQLRW